jgi:hypothetical protein
MTQTSSAIVAAVKPAMEYAMLCMIMRLANARYSARCVRTDQGTVYADVAVRHPGWRRGVALGHDARGLPTFQDPRVNPNYESDSMAPWRG